MYRQNEGFGLYFYATLALIWLNMNGLDSNVAPLIYGSLLPAAILIIVSFVCEQISRRKFRQAINYYGITRKGVIRRSVIAGVCIFVLMFFPLPYDIAIMIIALAFSLSTAAITFYARNTAGAVVLSVAVIGGIISAGTALMTLIDGSLNPNQQLGTVLATWPILAGPGLVAAVISAALSASAKSTSY